MSYTTPDPLIRTTIVLRQSQLDCLRELADAEDDRSVSWLLRKIISGYLGKDESPFVWGSEITSATT